MTITNLTTTELALVIALAVIVVAAIATLLVLRKRRTESRPDRLRPQFGGAEYARVVKDEGRRHAEAGGQNEWRV